MKNPKRQTDSQLEFNIKDCNEAISAMPTNKKIYQYLQERSECESELLKRERIRMYRRERKTSIFDKLNFSFRSRWSIYNNAYNLDRFRTANWMLASYKRFDLI